MAFSYLAFATNRDRVRFHIGDTEEATAMLSNEDIDAIITEEGDWQKATIACLDYIIVKLSSSPDFTADWLKVDSSKAVARLTALRDKKASEWGIVVGVSAVNDTTIGSHVYRKDSLQTSEPTYED